jgi:hypothetical protein
MVPIEEAEMREARFTYIALAGAALVLAGFVPAVSNAATGSADPGARASVARKGDRLRSLQPAVRLEIANTHVVGDPGRSVVQMRTRAGDVAYSADGQVGITLAAKNVVFPPIPERMVMQPRRVAVEATQPASTRARNILPVGCERLVSVLVKSSERDRIGRCLS